MGKKKKQKSSSKSAQAGEAKGALQYNPFAASLKSRKKDLNAKARREEEALQDAARRRMEQIKQAEVDQRLLVGLDEFRRGADVEMTEEELFAAAVDGIDAIQIERGKYGGMGPVAGHVQIQEPKPEEPEDVYNREDRLFAAEFDWSEVTPIKQNTFLPEPLTRKEIDALYRFKQKDHTGPGRRELEVEAILNPGKLSLNADQARLLEDARRSRRDGGLREISVRQLGRDAALQMLDTNIKSCVVGGQRHLRVITGKGLQSAGEPVLKRALVEWCLSLDIVYAPEILQDGTFGSFVLRVPKAEKKTSS